MSIFSPYKGESMLKYILALFLFLTGVPMVYGSAVLREAISVGTATPALGTSTLGNAMYDAAPYFEAFYTFHGSGTVYFTFDGGTVTTSNGHAVQDMGSFKLSNITDARRVQFIATIPGSLIATYSTSKEPIR